MSSVLVILFFYSLPIVINFTTNKIESSAGIQNNSKAILAYTLNKKSSNSSNSQTLNEDDLLIDIYSLNDQETDTVRLDASTIKQLFEDTDYKLDDVRKALTEIGVEGLTASEVRGFGRQRGQTEIYRGTEYSVSFVPKLKIELAVPDELEEKVLETLNKSANTGQIGDGKIFVFDIKSATRIRTGETGNDALS